MKPEAVVREALASYLLVPPEALRSEQRLVADLHLDGDDYGMGVVREIQKRLGFKAPHREWEQVVTVGDLIAIARQHHREPNAPRADGASA